MSKTMAKWSTGAHVIDTPQSADEQWLVGTVRRLAEKAGIGMPEVAVYEGEPNAFATGAFRDSSLVAVSTGLLQSMTQRGSRGGPRPRGGARRQRRHGDAHADPGRGEHLRRVPRARGRLRRRQGGVPDRARRRARATTITVIVCEIVFGILASIIVAWFSRQREFRADAGAAALHGHAAADDRRRCAAWAASSPASCRRRFQSSGIADKPGFLALFSTHPPIEARIAALEIARLTARPRRRAPPVRRSPSSS